MLSSNISSAGGGGGGADSIIEKIRRMCMERFFVAFYNPILFSLIVYSPWCC